MLISSILTVPPRLLNRPSLDLSLTTLLNLKESPDVFESKFLEIRDDLQDFRQIYTDGSKTNNGTAAAAVSCDVIKSL